MSPPVKKQKNKKWKLFSDERLVPRLNLTDERIPAIGEQKEV